MDLAEGNSIGDNSIQMSQSLRPLIIHLHYYNHFKIPTNRATL